MIQEKTYTFTNYMSSGNPFAWFADNTKEYQISFCTSLDTDQWDQELRIGDKVTLWRDGNTTNNDIVKASINGKIVFELTPEKAEQKRLRTEAIYDNLKREKGLI